MNWVFGILILLLIISNYINYKKNKNLDSSLKKTNDALQETRGLVAKHNSLIKRHLPYQNR